MRIEQRFMRIATAAAAVITFSLIEKNKASAPPESPVPFSESDTSEQDYQTALKHLPALYAPGGEIDRDSFAIAYKILSLSSDEYNTLTSADSSGSNGDSHTYDAIIYAFLHARDTGPSQIRVQIFNQVFRVPGRVLDALKIATNNTGHTDRETAIVLRDNGEPTSWFFKRHDTWVTILEPLDMIYVAHGSHALYESEGACLSAGYPIGEIVRILYEHCEASIIIDAREYLIRYGDPSPVAQIDPFKNADEFLQRVTEMQ